MTHSHQQPESPERRGFLAMISVGLGALATLALGIPLVGYIAGAIWRPTKDEWIDLGPVLDYPVGQTRLKKFVAREMIQPWDGMTGNAAAYVRHESEGVFKVFSIYCAHLGCPVSWFPQSGLFMCPCHGGVYYEDGSHASGPPPRGLYLYPVEIRDGRVWIFGGHLPTLQDTFKHPENV